MTSQSLSHKMAYHVVFNPAIHSKDLHGVSFPVYFHLGIAYLGDQISLFGFSKVVVSVEPDSRERACFGSKDIRASIAPRSLIRFVNARVSNP